MKNIYDFFFTLKHVNEEENKALHNDLIAINHPNSIKYLQSM